MKIVLKLNGGSGTGDSNGTTMPIYCTTTLKVTNGLSQPLSSTDIAPEQVGVGKAEENQLNTSKGDPEDTTHSSSSSSITHLWCTSTRAGGTPTYIT